MDNENAKILADVLTDLPFVVRVLETDTNIVIFELTNKKTTDAFIQTLAKNDIKVIPFGDTLVRMVTHLDFTAAMLEKTTVVLQGMKIVAN